MHNAAHRKRPQSTLIEQLRECWSRNSHAGTLQLVYLRSLSVLCTYPRTPEHLQYCACQQCDSLITVPFWELSRLLTGPPRKAEVRPLPALTASPALHFCRGHSELGLLALPMLALGISITLGSLVILRKETQCDQLMEPCSYSGEFLFPHWGLLSLPVCPLSFHSLFHSKARVLESLGSGPGSRLINPLILSRRPSPELTKIPCGCSAWQALQWLPGQAAARTKRTEAFCVHFWVFVNTETHIYMYRHPYTCVSF